MNWFAQILAGVFPRATGLEVDEPDPLAFQLPPSPTRFFEALGHLVGPEATLYWEGPAGRTLAAWLDRYTSAPRPRVSVGVMPVGDFYLVPLTDEVLEELAVRDTEPGALRGPVRIHVHEGERITLQWRPAFGKRPLLLSRRLPADRVREFVAAANATPIRRTTAT